MRIGPPSNTDPSGTTRVGVLPPGVFDAHTIAEFGEHKYPLDERLESMARWIDMLDRI